MDEQRNADEQAHYEALRAIKLSRLRVVERQIERQGGDTRAEPALIVERTELRAYLGIVEVAISSAVPATAGDDLGPSGRFVVTVEEQRRTSKAVADLVSTVDSLERRFDVFITETVLWRGQKDDEDAMHRQWIVIVAVAVFILALLVVAVVTWLAARGI